MASHEQLFSRDVAFFFGSGTALQVPYFRLFSAGTSKKGGNPSPPFTTSN